MAGQVMSRTYGMDTECCKDVEKLEFDRKSVRQRLIDDGQEHVNRTEGQQAIQATMRRY